MNDQQHRSNHDVPPWRRSAEWILLVLSSLLLLFIAGYLVVQLLSSGEDPGRVEATVLLEMAEQHDRQWIVPLIIENHGHTALRDVTIRVTRQKAGEAAAISEEVQLAFLGEKSRQEVSLYFDEDPRPYDVTAKPIHHIH